MFWGKKTKLLFSKYCDIFEYAYLAIPNKTLNKAIQNCLFVTKCLSATHKQF